MSTELTRTKIFQDPLKSNRFIRGVLFGNKTKTGGILKYTRMEVWFYHNKHDVTPYWKTSYGLHGSDSSFVAYHRRPLFHGLQNNLRRSNFRN